MTSDQLIAHLDLGDEIGNATIKLTTRQSIQLHGILKGNLRQAIHRINQIGLSTLSACGDVNRNVMCCPVPRSDSIHAEMQKLTDEIMLRLAPRTRAYYELWITDEATGERTLVGGSPDEDVEPVYGKHYLPRKFKTAIGLPEDNCVDIYSQDLGFLAVVRNGKIIGYNVLVGGGFGATPANKKTFPAIAQRMAFVTPEQAVDVAEAVVKVQRDNGNRSDRKVARMKYLIADKGIAWFREQVEKYYGSKLQDCTDDDVHEHEDHIGWEAQGNGKWYYGFNVENGRLYDDDHRHWKAAIREICAEIKPGIRLTAHQSILFTDLELSDRPRIESIIKKHGLPLSEEISTVRRWSMSCVALPTCGLAITESERVLPDLISQIESELKQLGLESERFTVRMTGCPNGCARPYNSDIGLVGKAKDKYTLFLGGSRLGTRLSFIHRDLVPFNEIVPKLRPIFTAYAQHRTDGESFGDFCQRSGNDQLLAWSDAEAVV